MIESKWVTLKSDFIAPDRTPDDAYWVREAPSPYDVPTHVRSFYNPESGNLTIEFKHIADEELSEREILPYFRLMVGKKTHRIYALRFDIHTFNRDRKRIAEETKNTIAALAESDVPTREITLRAIRSQEQNLFSQVG